jgi:hypothetical protein
MEQRRGIELTEKQKTWVRDRDDNKCNFPVLWTDTTYDRCGRRRLQYEVHVHHIVPYSWAANRLEWSPEEINHPSNLITLCKDHHFDYVHGTDMRDIYRRYRENPDTFQQMFAERRRLTEEGTPYWDPTWDHVFIAIAVGRTERRLESADWPVRRIRRLPTTAPNLIFKN